jgi:hypothetical protein
MITQRTQGLYRVFLLCQIALVAGLFWVGVWFMVIFSRGEPDLNRYTLLRNPRHRSSG